MQRLCIDCDAYALGMKLLSLTFDLAVEPWWQDLLVANSHMSEHKDKPVLLLILEP